MTTPGPALYRGRVVHRRLRPLSHELGYEVASLLVDIDHLHNGDLPGLLGYNRFNLFGVYDSDHGERQGGESLSAFAWRKVAEAGAAGDVSRILMLSYPRILGYAFNPLTVFYGLDASGEVRLLIYEVHNTFGGRHCYVAGPFASGAPTYAETEKTFPVSPFNAVEGHYGLRATVPGARVAVGVSLSTAEGPVLKAWFSGGRQPLGNRQLLAVFFGLPLMTLKVTAAIHWEALKLWLKGLNLQS